MLLLLLEELGKVIKAAEQGHGRVFHEEAFPLCRYTDTESDHARFGKILLSPMAAWGHCTCPRLRSLLEQSSSLQHSLSPHGGAYTPAVKPFPDGPLSRIGVIFSKINSGKAADGAAVHQGIFHGFVAQGPPVLHQVNP